VATTTAGVDGRFTISLPAGTYVLTGTSQGAAGVSCLSPPVVVNNKGRHLVVVAHRAGRYQHATDERDRELAAGIDRLVRAAREEGVTPLRPANAR